MGVIEISGVEQELGAGHYQQLEAGHILLFPKTPIEFSKEDHGFLLRQRQADASYYKNIAYRPSQDRLTGVARGGNRGQLRRLLASYCHQAAELIASLLPRYAAHWRTDFTSFRPFEEAGRRLSLHSRNDLLHIDAFPTRPTQGDRILRFFTNIHPTEPRVWLTSDPFDSLAERFWREANLAEEGRRLSSPFRQAVARLARRARLPLFRSSPYDALMHLFHNFLKENTPFQETCSKLRVEFVPMSSWLVFTDMASHAVLSGQFALEQTFIVSREAMLHREKAPLSILERLVGVSLTWHG